MILWPGPRGWRAAVDCTLQQAESLSAKQLEIFLNIRHVEDWRISMQNGFWEKNRTMYTNWLQQHSISDHYFFQLKCWVWRLERRAPPRNGDYLVNLLILTASLSSLEIDIKTFLSASQGGVFSWHYRLFFVLSWSMKTEETWQIFIFIIEQQLFWPLTLILVYYSCDHQAWIIWIHGPSPSTEWSIVSELDKTFQTKYIRHYEAWRCCSMVLMVPNESQT